MSIRATGSEPRGVADSIVTDTPVDQGSVTGTTTGGTIATTAGSASGTTATTGDEPAARLEAGLRPRGLSSRANVSTLDGLAAPSGRITAPNNSPTTTGTETTAGTTGAATVEAPTTVSETAPVTATDGVREADGVDPQRSIPAARSEQKSWWDKLWAGVGTFFNAIGSVFAKVVDLAIDAVSIITNAVIFALASPALLFGVSPQKLWNGIRSVVGPTFETISGLAQGAVQMPFQALGVGFNFVKNFFSFGWVTSGSKAIELVTQPILGALFTAVSPLFFGLKGLSDSLAPPRPLTTSERASMSGYYPEDVIDRIRVVEAPSLIQRIFMMPGTGAFTIGDTVYGSPGDSNMAGSLIRHETIHTLQYRETPGGEVGFLASYFTRWFGNFMTNGFDNFGAYRNLPAEQEAYGLENGPRRR